MPKPLLLAGSAGGLSGGVKDDDDTFESRRPSRRERIERERTLGGGWRTAEARLARAPLEDLEEVADKLGRLPYETLCYGMNPRAAAAKARAETPARETIVTPGGTVEPTIVKLPHARARVDDCEIPNGDGRTQPQVPASAREASLAAFDAMGRRLAAVFKEGSAHTLKVFDCATGAILASFPGHAAAVYDVSWEPERSSDAEERLGTVDFERRPARVMTASADGTAKIWTVDATDGAHTGDAVAQHACECYGAVWHPLVPDVVATAARDGGVRLWRVPSIRDSPPGETGTARIITGVAPTRDVAATAAAFDKGGYRLFVGFADGMVREHIVELKDEASLRPLRECKDTLGEPVTCVRVAPNNRKVLARTFADRVVAIDVEFFGATHNFDCGGARRHRRAPVLSEMAKHGAGGSHPLLRFAVSPDSRFVVAGTPDGDARLFDLNVGGVGVSLHAARAPPGVAVNDVSWSPGRTAWRWLPAGEGNRSASRDTPKVAETRRRRRDRDATNSSRPCPARSSPRGSSSSARRRGSRRSNARDRCFRRDLPRTPCGRCCGARGWTRRGRGRRRWTTPGDIGRPPRGRDPPGGPPRRRARRRGSRRTRRRQPRRGKKRERRRTSNEGKSRSIRTRRDEGRARRTRREGSGSPRRGSDVQ